MLSSGINPYRTAEPDPDLEGQLFKMIKLMEIDLFFNLEHHSVDSEHNFEKFTSDMLQIYEEERLSAIEPKIPKIPESYGDKQ